MPDWLAALAGNPDILAAVVVGFLAQLIDGSLGMGFGVLSYTLLSGAGLDPRSVSATVNTAKIFTGAAAAAAHVREGNIDRGSLVGLALGGVAGALVGSLLLIVASGEQLKLFVNIYLLLVGVMVLQRVRRPRQQAASHKRQFGIGLLGGLLEALAGIWGPFVTGNLIERGGTPRYVVGASTVCETIVAVTVSAVLIGNLGLASVSTLAVGLIGGALLAAPIAARLTRKLPSTVAIICIGLLVIVTSLTRLAQQLL